MEDINYTKYFDALNKIIIDLEVKKKSNDYQLLVIKEEYEKTLKEVQNKNLEKSKERKGERRNDVIFKSRMETNRKDMQEQESAL